MYRGVPFRRLQCYTPMPRTEKGFLEGSGKKENKKAHTPFRFALFSEI